MNNKLFVGLIVVAVGVLAGWYFLKGQSTPMTPTNQMTETPTPAGSNLGAPDTSTPSVTNSMEKGGVQARTVVTLSDAGFAPASVTVKVGTTVSFVNESAGPMWVATDPHPSHTLLPGFDELSVGAKGSTYEYTFAKVGTWPYHNHRVPSQKGTVIVTQ